jgi:FAD:protein FMN transferase
MNRGDDELLIRVSRRAMASEFEVCFPAGTCGGGTDFALESLDLVESLEDRLSYFRPKSEISAINRLAADEPVEAARDLFDLLLLAMRLREETSGAYDITSAPLWDVWGFARRKGQIPTEAQLAEARSNVGGHLIELDPDQQTIRFLKPGVKINLGSIGKGYALDVCADRLLSLGMKEFLIHGGQSSVLARGTWEIGVPNPLQPLQRLGILRLGNRALGTSGGQFQSFRQQGRRYGHIVDPRSGWPAEGVISTTVLAPTAAMADALSTAFYVLGPAPSVAYCQAHSEIGLLMLCPSQSGGVLEIHRAGLGEDDLVLCEN